VRNIFIAAITFFTTTAVIFVIGFLLSCRDLDRYQKDDEAKANSKTLETGAESYRLKFGEYPSKLSDLVNPPDGGQPFVDASAINDPWGRPYQYDPAGPRNEGKKPDIWTTGHDGKPIGNWREPRHWWEW
jgi:hypothetical protein